RRERGMRKTALATGLAAGLVLFAVGLLAIQPTPERREPYVADALVQKLLAHDLNLAKAKTGQERLRELKGLADDLRGAAEMLARLSAKEELGAVAGLYERVLVNGVVAHARKVAADREGLLDVAFKLDAARRDAEKLARECPDSARPLNQIIVATRTAEDAV